MYFCYSWHEVGCYDLPAMIDYILDKTGHSKLYYIGYSQGTTAFYVMASERSEYNAKIKGMISLAPIAYIGNQKSPLLKCVVRFHYLMKVMHFDVMHLLIIRDIKHIYDKLLLYFSGDLLFAI